MQRKDFYYFMFLIPGAESYIWVQETIVPVYCNLWEIVALACIKIRMVCTILPLSGHIVFPVHNLKSLPEEVFYLQKMNIHFTFSYVLEHKTRC